jgi:SPP1 gp7 family putative phage head morphogenesis protein
VTRTVSLLTAASAAEELASELLGVDVRKAIDPLTPKGFLLISEAVAKSLARAAAGAEASVVSDVLGELNLDWKGMSTEAASAAMKAINGAISKSYRKRLVPKVDGILEVEAPKLMKSSRKATASREKLKISMTRSQRDKDAERWVRTSQVNFIRDSSDERATKLSVKARSIVAKGLEKGLGSEVIANDLKKTFKEDIPRPDSYWRVVSDSFVGRARIASMIGAYEDAEIESYRVVAVIDEVTTDICRFMDGRVFKVSDARRVLDSLMDLADPEDVKYAHPWVRKAVDEKGRSWLYVPRADGKVEPIARITRSGVGVADDKGTYASAIGDARLAAIGIPIPPYHGRCRSTIVAVTD